MIKQHLNDLTVFVISTGEETTADCETALFNQDCGFEIRLIKDVYPMSAAFQAMPNKCTTPYFIQVDADMILNSNAIRLLYDGIKDTGFFTMAVYGQLYEEGFGVGGSIRCWKRNFFNYFSFRDRRTVDRDLYWRAKWFGFTRNNLNQILGIHRPRHSMFSEYLKTRSDIEKWRFLGRKSELYAEPLFDLVVAKGLGSYRLLGLLTGAISAKHRYERSKDYAIEKKRYGLLMESLGYTSGENDLVIRSLSPIVKELFINCYSDFKGQRVNEQKAIIGIIIELFCKDLTLSFDTNNLLKILTD